MSNVAVEPDKKAHPIMDIAARPKPAAVAAPTPIEQRPASVNVQAQPVAPPPTDSSAPLPLQVDPSSTETPPASSITPKKAPKTSSSAAVVALTLVVAAALMATAVWVYYKAH